MNPVIPTSLLGIILLVGVVAVLLLVLFLYLNATAMRRIVGRMFAKDKRHNHGARPQGWTEAGRRVSTPSPRDVESQFGTSSDEPPTKEHP